MSASMIRLGVIAACAVAVLIAEVLMVRLESAIPAVGGKWGALSYVVLFVVFGFVVRRLTSTGTSLLGVFAAAIAFVTLGYWIVGYVSGSPRGWLGPPATIVIAALYFFALMAIGVGAASWKRWRWNR